MKDGLRFVDCDMHVMEPPDLFERYLDARFRDRVILSIGADGKPKRGPIFIDGLPTSQDAEMQQYRKRASSQGPANVTTQPLSGSRIQASKRLDFAIERKYDAEAQVMGMAMEGIDIAVLFPTAGRPDRARQSGSAVIVGALSGVQQLGVRLHELQSRALEVRGDATLP
jgi:hypothetical protein